jgi:hypothetical protein
VWTKGRFPFLKELPGFSGLGEELRLIYEFEERGGEAFPELKGAVRKHRRDGIKALIRQMDAADHDLEYGRANTTDYSVALARVRTFNSEEQSARPIPTLWNAVKSAPVVGVRRPRFAGPARVSTMPALPEIPKDYPEGWDFQPATDGVGYRFSTDDYEYTITSDDHKYRFGIARAELDGLQFTMDPAVGKRVKKEKKAGLPPLDERRRKNARIIVPMAVIDPGSHTQTPDQIKALYDKRRSQRQCDYLYALSPSTGGRKFGRELDSICGIPGSYNVSEHGDSCTRRGCMLFRVKTYRVLGELREVAAKVGEDRTVESLTDAIAAWTAENGRNVVQPSRRGRGGVDGGKEFFWVTRGGEAQAGIRFSSSDSGPGGREEERQDEVGAEWESTGRRLVRGKSAGSGKARFVYEDGTSREVDIKSSDSPSFFSVLNKYYVIVKTTAEMRRIGAGIGLPPEQIATSKFRDAMFKSGGFVPRCFACREEGHVRQNCPNVSTTDSVRRGRAAMREAKRPRKPG